MKSFDRIILCTDAPKGQGLAYYYYRAFCDVLGEEKVRIVHEGNRDYGASVFERGMRRFNREIGKLSQMRFDRLVAELSNSNNLVVLFNNADLRGQEIQRLAAVKNVYLVNYLSDSPYGIVPSFQREILSSIPEFDLVCTFAKDLVSVLYQLGAKRVARIPFGYCKYTHFEPALNVQIEYPNLVYYFGTWTKEIEQWVRHLLEFDLRIEGNGWSKASSAELRNLGAKRHPETDQRMAVLARKAGVVVNFTRAKHGCFHTMKTFELAAAGACVICNFSREQEEFFKNDRSTIYFNTPEEMIRKVSFFSTHIDEGNKIREQAIKDSLQHSYHNRVIELLTII